MNKNIWVPIAVVMIFAGFIGGHFLEKYLDHQEKTSLSALTASMAKAASEPSTDNEEDDSTEDEQPDADAAQQDIPDDQQQEQSQIALSDLFKIMAQDSHQDQYGINVPTKVKLISRVKGLVLTGAQINGGDCYNIPFKKPYTFVQGGYITLSTRCDESSIMSITVETNYGTVTDNVEF